MKVLKLIVILIVIASCSRDDENTAIIINTLEDYVSGKTIETGAVIACAASENNTNAVLTFFYPKEGATNIQYFETEDTNVTNSNFNNYKKISLESSPFFNGYLRFFKTELTTEKWIIVTYELNGEIKISNPIRTKQVTKPSVWNNDVTINQELNLMPQFSWEANAFGDNAIYFQVLSDSENNLISGTYTYDNQFKYYDTTNVVLNITQGTPPTLVSNTMYNYTLMDVSLDNWVNLVAQKPFITE
ncbi:hypothetical protein [Pontimicrobium sp. MEBiC06410]|jgi:hypothetical protein